MACDSLVSVHVLCKGSCPAINVTDPATCNPDTELVGAQKLFAFACCTYALWQSLQHWITISTLTRPDM
jgi:hypothetical protein